MKNEINPVVAAAVVFVILLVVAGIGYVSANREVKAPPPSSGPIELPSSQVGTKLGGQVLGGQGPATGVQGK